VGPVRPARTRRHGQRPGGHEPFSACIDQGRETLYRPRTQQAQVVRPREHHFLDGLEESLLPQGSPEGQSEVKRYPDARNLFSRLPAVRLTGIENGDSLGKLATEVVMIRNYEIHSQRARLRHFTSTPISMHNGLQNFARRAR